MEKEFKLISETGLHARPATNFVRFMSTLPANVYIIHKDFVADAKSIMAVMSMGLAKHATFVIRIDPPSEEIMQKIEQYMREQNFIK